MQRQSPRRPSRISRCGLSFRLALTTVLLLVAVSGLIRFWSLGFVLFKNDRDTMADPFGPTSNYWSMVHADISIGPLVTVLAKKIANLQAKLGHSMQEIHDELGHKSSSSSSDNELGDKSSSDCGIFQLREEKLKHSNLLVEIVASLDTMLEILQRGSSLDQSINDQRNTGEVQAGEEQHEFAEEEEEEEEEGSVLIGNYKFKSQELRKYTAPKQNRHGRKNFMGVQAIYPSIGSGCHSMSLEVDQYMLYNVSGRCPDDWPTAQQLMVQGCDPPPRRRCFSRTPDRFIRPLPFKSSLWTLPNDRNIRWTHYKCKGFACLTSKNSSKGFFKCAECFDLSAHESQRWIANNSNNRAEFSVDQVLGLKAAGEVRVGLDFSPGTGTFAALMHARNITIATATLNLGAPFNEIIALRGLLPFYVSINQRLPFFDNTLDIVHTTLFLDGWIDVELLEFVLFDWDRVLRPGGLLWIDRFFCSNLDIEEYLGLFKKLGYKKNLWIVAPKVDKDGGEVFFSAVLEKPI
eukprot:Gb_17509 [translate_table: standard]